MGLLLSLVVLVEGVYLPMRAYMSFENAYWLVKSCIQSCISWFRGNIDFP